MSLYIIGNEIGPNKQININIFNWNGDFIMTLISTIVRHRGATINYFHAQIL